MKRADFYQTLSLAITLLFIAQKEPQWAAVTVLFAILIGVDDIRDKLSKWLAPLAMCAYNGGILSDARRTLA